MPLAQTRALMASPDRFGTLNDFDLERLDVRGDLPVRGDRGPGGRGAGGPGLCALPQPRADRSPKGDVPGAAGPRQRGGRELRRDRAVPVRRGRPDASAEGRARLRLHQGTPARRSSDGPQDRSQPVPLAAWRPDPRRVVRRSAAARGPARHPPACGTPATSSRLASCTG